MQDDEETKDILSNTVTQTNKAIRATQYLTLTEKRIIMLAISFLFSTKRAIKYSSEESRKFKITASDYQAVAQLSSEKDAYKHLINASDKLMLRYMTTKRQTPKGLKTIKTAWLEKATYLIGEASIEVQFTQSVMPFLLDIKEHFTKYKLAQVSSFRSLYTWRLLEYFMSWSDEKGEGFNTITVERFTEMLAIPISYKYHDIKRKIIIPSVDELEKKDGWRVVYKEIKKRQKIIKLEFKWERKK